MHRSALPAFGAVATITTAAALIYLIILSGRAQQSTIVLTPTMVSVTMQALTLLIIGWAASVCIFSKMHEIFARFNLPIVALGVVLSIVSASVCLTTVVRLGNGNTGDKALDVDGQILAQGLAAFTILAWISQIAFLVVQFMSNRAISLGAKRIFSPQRAGGWSPSSYIKSIRYSQTMPRMSESTDSTSVKTQPSPLAARSTMRSPSSLKTSVGQAMRPMASRTRLLSTREKSRPISINTRLFHNNVNESFDSWDTSAVDLHHRQVVMEVASSPTTAKHPTIQTTPDIIARPAEVLFDATSSSYFPRRTRSFSPSPAPRTSLLDIPPSPGEPHIHPLFRNDSPNAAAAAGGSPESVVYASPIPGRLLVVDRGSFHPMKRVRSGSLPTSPSTQTVEFDYASFELSCPSPLSPLPPALVSDRQILGTERKMTPPIPEWLLNPPKSRRPSGDTLEGPSA